MIINTESTIGYNNNLNQVVAGMKLGVTNEMNLGTKNSDRRWRIKYEPAKQPSTYLDSFESYGGYKAAATSVRPRSRSTARLML